jgi:hypothetical protein
MTFNPYHEWLQIDEQNLQPTYYELLGIKPSEADQGAIAAAAERAACRVRSHRPGANAAAWAELLDEIAAAKKCLLDPNNRQQYDRQIKSLVAEPPKATPLSPSRSDANPPGAIPRTAGASEKSKTATPAKKPLGVADASAPLDPPSPYKAMQPWVPPANAPNPMAPLVSDSASVPYLSAVEADVPPNPMAPLAPLAPAPVAKAEPIVATLASADGNDQGRTLPGWLLPVGIGAGGGLLLLVVLFVVRNLIAPQSVELAQQAETPPKSADVAAVENTTEPSKLPPVDNPLGNTVLPPIENAQQVLSPLADAQKAIPNNLKEQGEVKPQPNVKSDSPATEELKSEVVVTDERVSKSAPRSPATQDANAVGTKPAEPKAPTEPKATTDPVPSSPTPEVPRSTPAKPEPTISKQEFIKLGRAMQKTRDAISNHEFDLAAEFLAIAAKMPQLPEHTAKLERLRLLRDAVKQYREAIDRSVSKLEVGVTFDVDKTVVGVVEASRDRVVFRVTGRNMTYSIPELPPGLAVVLAEQSLPEKDPATIMMKGAFIISSRKASKADLTKAHGFLEAAAASDETAKALIPILDDTYDLTKEMP